MSLITPDFGLIFWMVIIFGLVFLILAKFGFPVITNMVQKRSDHIAEALKGAEEARKQLEEIKRLQDEMIQEAKLERSRILKEASVLHDKIIEEARKEAFNEASKIIEHSKHEIAAERESAIRQIRREVAMISVNVAEKLIRKELLKDEQQIQLIDRMVDEMSQTSMN